MESTNIAAKTQNIEQNHLTKSPEVIDKPMFESLPGTAGRGTPANKHQEKIVSIESFRLDKSMDKE